MRTIVNAKEKFKVATLRIIRVITAIAFTSILTASASTAFADGNDNHDFPKSPWDHSPVQGLDNYVPVINESAYPWSKKTRICRL